MAKYPYPCSRCGFCCLIEQCPISIILHGIRPECPALSFKEGLAECAYAGERVPIGDGCCIKASAYKDGVKYDFASLPAEFKYIAANQFKMRKLICMEEK